MLSAKVLGGATYILRLVGTVVEGTSVLIVAWVEAYPDAIAVMLGEPAAVLVTLAKAYVWPPVIVTEDATDAIVLFEDERVTLRPSNGAFAGEPLESCS